MAWTQLKVVSRRTNPLTLSIQMVILPRLRFRIKFQRLMMSQKSHPAEKIKEK